MGFLDKAREAAGNAMEKAAPHLEKAKEKAGPLVEKAAEKADKATGGKYSNQIDGVKGKVEGALGQSGPTAPGAGTHTAGGGDVPAVPPTPPGGDALRPQGNPADSQPPAVPPAAGGKPATGKRDDGDGGVPAVPPPPGN